VNEFTASSPPEPAPQILCAACGDHTSIAALGCAACKKSPLLDGRYALEAKIGSGSVGTTYLARNVQTDERVAIKELQLAAADSPKLLELFGREARVLGQLQHEGIPKYVDDFVAGEGKSRAIYICQEFIDGISLAQEMAGKRYNPGEVLTICGEILPILAYLHHLSPPVIHRDVKPGNIMRRSDGSLVLVDFGSVRDVLKDSDIGGSTVAGTFGYMAPEQFAGEAFPATDLYGLGALAVTLLTRREPHTMLEPNGKIHWEPHTNVGPAVSALLRGLLELDVSNRAQSAEQVLHWLGAARMTPAHLPIPPIPTGPGKSVKRAQGPSAHQMPAQYTAPSELMPTLKPDTAKQLVPPRRAGPIQESKPPITAIVAVTVVATVIGTILVTILAMTALGL